MAQHLINPHSFVSGKTPATTSVEYGEIAVNCNSNDPFISIKVATSPTATGEIEKFSPDSVIDKKIAIQSSIGINSGLQKIEAETFTNKNINSLTHGQEINAEASGDYSLALGGDNAATAKRAVAQGHRCIAHGENSHAEGHCAVVEYVDDTYNGYGSHAEGYSTIVTGTYSHAEGNKTIVNASNGHAEGHESIVSGDASHAEGYGTQANAIASHAEGNNTKTSKNYSHAEGRQTETIGEASHTEGNETITEGDYAHAEGWMTRAKGAYSHAEGQYTFTYADAAHSEGNNTHAHAPFSHAEGLGTKTNPDIIGQHVEGYYNAESDGVKVIGCGTSDEDRKNAVEVKQDGRVFVNGLGNFDGTNSNDASDLKHVIDNKANSGDVYNKTEMDNRIKADLVQKVEVATINGQSLINGGNIVIEDSDDVFVAEYGVTDYDEVISAYNSGKICICKHDDNIYYGYKVDSSISRFIFTCIQYWAASGNNSIDLLYLNVRKVLSTTYWDPIVTHSAEKSENKTETINANSTDIQYPSAKAVYDALTAKADNSAATTSAAGLMSAADKTKLDGIAINANNYSLPLAANGTRGGIQIGYTASGPNVPVQLSLEKAYVALTQTAVISALGYTPPTSDTHHAAYLRTGSETTSTSNTTDIENGVYFNLVEDGQVRSNTLVCGSTNVSVTSPTAGTIVITGPDLSGYATSTAFNNLFSSAVTNCVVASSATATAVTDTPLIPINGACFLKLLNANGEQQDYVRFTGSGGCKCYSSAGTIIVSANTNTDYQVESTYSSGSTASYILGSTSSGSVTGVTSKCSIYMTGNTLHGCTGYYQDSDERFKTFHGEIPLDLEKLRKLPKAYFTWNGDEEGQMQIGTSAQKVRELYPEIVSGSDDTRLDVDYTKLAVIALRGIDVLYDELEKTRSEMETMKSELDVIKQKLGI